MRAIVRILHKFSIENGQAVDKQTIQNAYRKHPMKNSLRCISDVLDEIGISHQVYPLESCSDQELKGKILYIPIEHNPIWLVSFQNSNNLTLSDGNIKKSITLKNLKMDTPIYVVHTKRTATDIKGQRNISYYFRNLIWDLGFYGLSALIFLSLFSLIFVNFCSFTTFLLRLCLFCGIVVSSSITIKKFTEFSSTKGLCNIIRTSGCKDVIDKNNSLLFGQIPIGDIALAYFLIEFVLSLSCPDDSVFSTFFYISCLTIPIVVYSVIWQIKRRTFCIKCLFTDLLLVVEFLLLLFAVNTWNANVRYILYFLLGCLSILLTITILRDNSLNEITYKRLVHKEESILSNPNLLTNLLQSEIQIIRRDDLDFPTINNGGGCTQTQYCQECRQHNCFGQRTDCRTRNTFPAHGTTRKIL